MGIVFDIQKFSLQDGPGIRTTVFLKGCPLSCVWCANPESQSVTPQLAFIQKNCQHCLDCLAVCPSQAHQAKNGQHVVNFQQCRHCGDCVAICPHNALKLYGSNMSVDQVLSIVLRDRDYYEKSGGGLTLSGGEPTYQFQFAKALLAGAKFHNIHTCIETAGYISPEKMQQLIPLVDCFLFDFKIYDDTLMQKYVGVSNKLILRNLGMLNKYEAPVILRCPIIPGINDSSGHFKSIAQLALMSNITKVQILPYHNYGRSKAKDIGKSCTLKIKAVPDELVEAWIKRLESMGCKAELA